MKLEVKLRHPYPPSMVTYPKGFTGRKSGSVEDTSFTISTTPTRLTEPEVALAQKFVERLQAAGIKQSLLFTGAIFLDRDDELMTANHEQLTAYETAHNLPSTASLPDGGRLCEYERLLRIRDYEARTKYAELLS